MQLIYTCPECGHDLQIQMLASNPPRTKYICHSCGWNYEEAQEDVVKIPFMTTSGPLNLPSPCENCNNNPKNGGSGICHCVLGSQVIY